MFSLAAHLGKWIWEVEEIPRTALLEYMAEYNISPWGEDRADLRVGVAAAMAHNLNLHKGQKARKPSEFMPNFEGPRRKSNEEIWAKLTMFAQAHNARLENQNG